MTPFEPQKFYRPDDPAVQPLATAGTLRVWRCHGKGPAYHKVGGKVLYKGEDLNAFVAATRRVPAEAPAAA